MQIYIFTFFFYKLHIFLFFSVLRVLVLWYVICMSIYILIATNLGCEWLSRFSKPVCRGMRMHLYEVKGLKKISFLMHCSAQAEYFVIDPFKSIKMVKKYRHRSALWHPCKGEKNQLKQYISPYFFKKKSKP